MHELRRLTAGTGHDDAFSEERTIVKPVHGASQVYHIPDDEDSRRLDPELLHIFCRFFKCRGIGLLVRARPPAYKCCRCLTRASVLHQLGGNHRGMADAHQEDQCIDTACQLVPVNGRLVFRRIFMSGNDGEGCCHTAMCDRNARIGRRRDGARDAGYFFERHAMCAEYLDLFPAASEDEGVTAFEAGNDLPRLAFFGQKLADLMLLHGVTACFFPDINVFVARLRISQKTRIRQIIADDNIGFFQAALALQCQKFRISRTSSDQIYFPFFHRNLLVFVSG